MMRRDFRFSRRALLKRIGAGAALLPLIEADPVDAQCIAGGIKRLYVFAWPDGMLSSTSKWATTGNDPASWSLASFQESLKPYQQDLLLLNGVDYKFLRDGPHSETTGHACYPGMLTGATYQSAGGSTANDVAGGPSIDQYIGSQLRSKGYTGLVSLNQGAFVESTARLSWSAAGKAVIPDLDPYHVFTTYIQGKITGPMGGGGMTPSGSGGASGTTTPDPKKVAQKSILDYVMGDLKRFSGIVGSADKASIEQHLTYVRDIENGLGSITGAGGMGGGATGSGGSTGTVGTGSACGIPAAATAMAVPYKSTDNIPTIAKLHMDLAIAAFAADLTRIAVMQIGDQGAAHLIPSWSPLNYKSGGPNPGDANTGDVNGFHAIAHRNVDDKVKCDGWFQSQIAYIIGQLKSVTDPSGKSMLDSSVVLAMNNMRTGTHETSGVPVVMAGSCGGYFKTGRSLALPAGTPNNGVLVAVCNAMGAPVQTFGTASYGGELTALKA